MSIQSLKTSYYVINIKGQPVKIRQDNGYLHATQLCKLSERKTYNIWRRLAETRHITKLIMRKYKIKREHVVQKLNKNSIWIHKDLVQCLAKWIGVEKEVMEAVAPLVYGIQPKETAIATFTEEQVKDPTPPPEESDAGSKCEIPDSEDSGSIGSIDYMRSMDTMGSMDYTGSVNSISSSDFTNEVKHQLEKMLIDIPKDINQFEKEEKEEKKEEKKEKI